MTLFSSCFPFNVGPSSENKPFFFLLLHNSASALGVSEADTYKFGSVHIGFPPPSTAMATLVDRAKKIADVEHLQEELGFLRETFVQHGFARREVNTIVYGNLKRSGMARRRRSD